MALFNRLLIIVLALAVFVTAGAVLLTTLGVIDPAQLTSATPWFADRLVLFTQLDPTNRALTLGVCSALIVVALLLLFLELRRGPRGGRQITLKEDALGRVTVALDEVRQLADHEAGRVPGVMRARSHVETEPPGLSISCRVSVDPASSIPAMTDELRERLKAAVEHHVGLAVTQVSVDAQVPPMATNRRHRRLA
jgi:hypothetical protein